MVCWIQGILWRVRVLRAAVGAGRRMQNFPLANKSYYNFELLALNGKLDGAMVGAAAGGSRDRGCAAGFAGDRVRIA